MKVKVFIDGNYRAYSEEEVSNSAWEMIEDSGGEMIEYFMQDIDTMGNSNPLFNALRDCDSEAFFKISREFQNFLESYKDNYISENFYESCVEV